MTVIVNRDGTAIIEDSVLFSGNTTGFMEMLMTDLDSAGLGSEEHHMWTDSNLRAIAPLMGEGVEFMRAQDIQVDSSKGYVAVYSARDINKLMIDKNAFHSKMQDQSQTEAGSTKQMSEVVSRFQFDGPTLTINNPPFNPNQDRPANADTTSDEEALASLGMAKSFMEGLEVGYRVRINGAIAETNASYVNGSDVTLFYFNFGEVIDSLQSNPGIFNTMRGTKPSSPGDLERAMNSLGNGARFETKQKVVVKFR